MPVKINNVIGIGTGNDQLVEVFWPDGPQALIKSGRVGPVL